MIKKDDIKLKCILLSVLVGAVLLAAVFAKYLVPYDQIGRASCRERV